MCGLVSPSKALGTRSAFTTCSGCQQPCGSCQSSLCSVPSIKYRWKESIGSLSAGKVGVVADGWIPSGHERSATIVWRPASRSSSSSGGAEPLRRTVGNSTVVYGTNCRLLSPMKRRASDNLPARISGPWAQEKLAYVAKYAGAFMAAMAPKRNARKWSELAYVDLLCGPGRGIDRHTGSEFPGSPLRALSIRPPFDRLFFSDLLKSNVDALRKRVNAQDAQRVTFNVGDCNVVARQVAAQLTGRSLALAFIDPEGFEVTFKVFQILASRRVDILFLFPSGIGIRRNLERFARRQTSPMDDLWGGREWRELPPAKLAAGRRLAEDEALSLDKPWVFACRAKMKQLGFIFQDKGDPCFFNEKNVPMYHLLFFSKDEAGLTIWRG